ncbi:MAG: MarR family transcriptional regulator [Planctomycetes bacterium]|nr:MarR family transcriptional regulator [Planctomycetota bacterium]
MSDELALDERVIIALRRITRAVDIHSDFMQRNFGITGPQLTILRVIDRLEPLSAGDLAKSANFNRGTLSGVLDRLESRGFVKRHRAPPDRRTVTLKMTAAGKQVLAEAPYLLRNHFLDALNRMTPVEQSSLLQTLEQTACLMEADSPDDQPVPPPPATSAERSAH